MASPYALEVDVDAHALAWDTLTQTERQPWRRFWPPADLDQITPEEKEAKPWLTWKRDPNQPNEKPWYHWCNIFEGEADLPCQQGGGRDTLCPYCGGQGCVSNDLIMQ